eukprot:871256-Rhodomonas_salina.2
MGPASWRGRGSRISSSRKLCRSWSRHSRSHVTALVKVTSQAAGRLTWRMRKRRCTRPAPPAGSSLAKQAGGVRKRKRQGKKGERFASVSSALNVSAAMHVDVEVSQGGPVGDGGSASMHHTARHTEMVAWRTEMVGERKARSCSTKGGTRNTRMPHEYRSIAAAVDTK